MKPSDRFGKFGCAPRELDPAWQEVSHYARAIGKELFVLVDDLAAMTVKTGDDWATSLCKTLNIDGPDRRNAKRAMKQLVDRGLLSIRQRHVVINLVPEDVSTLAPVGPDSASTRSPVGPDSVPKTSQECAILRFVPNRTEVEKNKTDSVPAASDPTTRVWALFAKARGVDPAILGAMGNNYCHARSIAKAAEKSCGSESGEEFDETVERMLRSWLSERWVIDNQPQLSHLAGNIPKYIGAAMPKAQQQMFGEVF